MKKVIVNNKEYRSRSLVCRELRIPYLSLLSAIRNNKNEVKSKDGRVFSLG